MRFFAPTCEIMEQKWPSQELFLKLQSSYLVGLGSKTLLLDSITLEHLGSIWEHFAPPLPLISNPGYNTCGTRKRTPYTQYPFQNMLRHPRGGYWLYMTVRKMWQFWPPFRSLENWYSLTPVCEKNMEMSYFDRPPYSSKFGEMFSFYSPFRPFVAFWINGRGWARVWASPSETHQSAPPPRADRPADKLRFQNMFTLTVRMGTVV